MLVEDDASGLDLAKSALESLSHKMVTATNDVERLDVLLLKRDEIDLILTDAVRPKMGGYQMLDKIRAEAPDLPLIMMSEYLETEAKESPDFLAAYVEKPLACPHLGNIVHPALRGRKKG